MKNTHILIAVLLLQTTQAFAQDDADTSVRILENALDRLENTSAATTASPMDTNRKTSSGALPEKLKLFLEKIKGMSPRMKKGLAVSAALLAAYGAKRTFDDNKEADEFKKIVTNGKKNDIESNEERFLQLAKKRPLTELESLLKQKDDINENTLGTITTFLLLRKDKLTEGEKEKLQEILNKPKAKTFLKEQFEKMPNTQGKKILMEDMPNTEGKKILMEDI